MAENDEQSLVQYANLCNKHVSRIWISNYISQNTVGVNYLYIPSMPVCLKIHTQVLIPMAQCNTGISPVHQQWRYCRFALSHRYDIMDTDISSPQSHTTDCINIATPYILHQCNISIYIIVTPYRHHVWSYTYFYMHMLAITPPYGESIYIVHSRTSLVTTQCSAMATTARLNMMMFWMVFLYIFI